MIYGNIHRFFLRTISSQGVLTLADANKVLEKFSEENQEEIQVKNIVKEINDAIRPYQQTIKVTNDEVTNEEILVFMSLGYDNATKSHKVFNANELEYFRILIEQIMTTESRQITGTHALNLVSNMKQNFKKVCAESILKTWCKMRYLDKEQNNNYALGVRAIHEFESYLRQNMPDTIEDCCHCKQIVFRGYNCPGCVAAIHTRCLKRYLDMVKKWPCCKLDYSEEQLERLNSDSSRLSQTQTDMTQQSVDYDTINVPTQPAESTEDIDMTPGTSMDTSQRLRKKRKRVIED